MRKFICVILSLLLAFSSTINLFAQTDDKIYTDPVQNTYIGRDEAKNLISNLKYNDIAKDFWAGEAIVRTGALNMTKGYPNGFRPNEIVSNEAALASVIRVMGLETAAQQEGARLQGAAQDDTNLYSESNLENVWYLGCLSVARQQNLITAAQYTDASNDDQLDIDPETGWYKSNPVTREQFAGWLVQGINYLSPNTLTINNSEQKIYEYSDWRNISAEHVQAVELLTSNNIMSGLTNGRFDPKGNLTRAEVAQILRNMDRIYYDATGQTSKTGTVAGIKDIQSNSTGAASLWRNIYIRNQEGQVDVLQYQLESAASPQAYDKDAVVYKYGDIGGLGILQEGDQIEYLVNDGADIVLYVQVKSEMQIKTVSGKLESIDFANGEIHIIDKTDKRFIYPIIKGIYGFETDANGNNKNYIMIDEKKRYENEIPFGSKFELNLKNSIVDQIKYLGDTTIVNEIKGIVIENNEGLGYIKVIDNNGNEVTKNYYSNDMVVEKQQYYDLSDEIGYFDQVFPNFNYDPRDTVISDIEPGDIVFMKLASDDNSAIESISASTNYAMKYGKIREFSNEGNISQILIEYEDKQTSWFDVADSVFVSKNGTPINLNQMQVGDWIKILVNQAVISPGYVMESVKEINVEGAGHEITNIIKGQLGAINQIQNKISIQNAQELDKHGWTDYQQIKDLDIANNDIEYYYEGKRIPLDYAMQYLKRAKGEVYVALENNFSGEKVRMVSFRTGRDEALNPDTIVSSDGVGNFNILSNEGSITTDPGTIVRRHGRLVTGNNIMIPDYATVVLNGNNKAAVVDIYDASDVSAAIVTRGLILSIDEGKSFKVQSMSQLSGMKWAYTPVQREFTVDYSTQFITANGVTDINSFIDYTNESAADKVYNIISDGTKATHIIESPYCTTGIRGVVYNNANGAIGVKDSKYYNSSRGNWANVSNKDNSVNVTTANNTIVIKDNKVVPVSQLQPGDKVRVMTDKLPNRIEGSMSINGYIIFVEG